MSFIRDFYGLFDNTLVNSALSIIGLPPESEFNNLICGSFVLFGSL